MDVYRISFNLALHLNHSTLNASYFPIFFKRGISKIHDLMLKRREVRKFVHSMMCQRRTKKTHTLQELRFAPHSRASWLLGVCVCDCSGNETAE